MNVEKATKEEVLEAMKKGTLNYSYDMNKLLRKVPIIEWTDGALLKQRDALLSGSAGNYKFESMTHIVIDEMNRRRHGEESAQTNRKFLLSLSVAIGFPILTLAASLWLSTQETEFDEGWVQNQNQRLDKMVELNQQMVTNQKELIELLKEQRKKPEDSKANGKKSD